MLTQNILLSNPKTIAEYWRFTAADVLLHALPIFYMRFFISGSAPLLDDLSRNKMGNVDKNILRGECPDIFATQKT